MSNKDIAIVAGALVLLVGFIGCIMLSSSNQSLPPTQPVAAGTGYSLRCFDNMSTTTAVSYLGPDCSASAFYQHGQRGFYLTTTSASTSLTISAPNVDSLDQHIYLAASSSATLLLWQNQYSQDGKTWYGESLPFSSTPIKGAGSLFLQASSTITHSWNPGKSGTSTIDVQLRSIEGPYERTLYQIKGGNGYLYVQDIAKAEVLQ